MPPNPPPNRPPPGRQQPSSSETSSATPGPSGTGSTGRGGLASGRGRPVQRLQSLKKRTPGGSLVPLNADGSTPKPTLKFQPKVVTRKSKEEREALENLEAQRLRERISAANATRRSTRGGDRGRGGRGRGRGGASGASGPLGGGTGPGRHGGAWKGKGGRSAKVSGIYGVKSEGGADGEDSRDISSDEGSDYGLRFSIDHINLESDSEGEEVAVGTTTKGKAALAKSTSRGGNRGLRPVRVERHEHVERTIGITSEASGGASKSAELRKQAKEKAGAANDSLFVEDDHSDDSDVDEDDDVVMGEIKESAHTTDGLQIKTEPTDDNAAIDDSIPPAVSEEDASKARAKAKKKVKDPRKKLQTEEERQEYDRYEEDVDYLKSTLGSLATAGKAPDSSTTGVEKKDEDDAENAVKPADERQGQLFLLQFPPLTPNLVPPTPEKSKATEQGEAVIETAATLPTDNNPQAQGSVTIKQEEGAINPDASASTSAPLVTATSSALPRGRVGKLNIHQSGKATIDWGGVSFELTKGSTIGFIQDAVILSDNMAGSADGGVASRDKKLWAMSQVTGKFVVTPDWDKILDE